MPLLRGEKILVTGANGQVGFPIARELAKANEVYGLARLSKAEDRARLEGAAVVMDPKASWEYAMEVNALATGRLLHHCRRAKGFLHCSSAAVYQDKGHEPIHEEDPLGDRMGSMVPTYSISKIAAEQVVRLGSSLWGVPATIARLGLPYGPNGGLPAMHLSWLLRDKPILLHGDAPIVNNPVFEDDFVEQAQRLAKVAQSPPLTVNWCGSDRVTSEEWCEYLGQLVGREPAYRYGAWGVGSLWLDPSRMHELIGKTRVPWREGMRRMAQARAPERLRE